MGKTGNSLIIAALAIGGFLWYENKQQGTQKDLLDDLLSSLGGFLPQISSSGGGGAQLPQLNLGTAFSGLGDLIKGLSDAINPANGGSILPGISGLLGDDGALSGNGTKSPSITDLVKQALNTPSQIIDSTGRLVESGGKSAIDIGTGIKIAGTGVLIGGATYLGVKYGGPVIEPIATGIGEGLGWLAGNLGADIAILPAAPVVGAAVLAGGLGYGLGSLFNITPPGKALLEWSGEQGEAFAKTDLGQKVFGIDTLTPYAKSILESGQSAAAKDIGNQPASPSNVEAQSTKYMPAPPSEIIALGGDASAVTQLSNGNLRLKSASQMQMA